MIDWIVVKLMHRFNIDATLKLTKGQGHKVKGQGQICNYLKKTVLAINQERKIVSLSNLYFGFIFMQH